MALSTSIPSSFFLNRLENYISQSSLQSGSRHQLEATAKTEDIKKKKKVDMMGGYFLSLLGSFHWPVRLSGCKIFLRRYLTSITSWRMQMWGASVHAQSCPTLCDPIYRGLPGFSVQGISQSGILEWIAVSSSRESSWPRDRNCISYTSFIGGWILYYCTACKAHSCGVVVFKTDA